MSNMRNYLYNIKKKKLRNDKMQNIIFLDVKKLKLTINFNY